MQFFCCQARESLFEIEAHLVSEDAYCTCAGPILFFDALLHNAVEQVEILFHI